MHTQDNEQLQQSNFSSMLQCKLGHIRCKIELQVLYIHILAQKEFALGMSTKTSTSAMHFSPIVEVLRISREIRVHVCHCKYTEIARVIPAFSVVTLENDGVRVGRDLINF